MIQCKYQKPGRVCLSRASVSVFHIEVDSVDDWIDTTVEDCCEVENIQNQTGNLNSFFFAQFLQFFFCTYSLILFERQGIFIKYFLASLYFSTFINFVRCEIPLDI